MQPASGDSNKDLEVGQSLLETEVAHSRYIGDDFLSYDPPPPTDPAVYRSSWYEFEVLSLGSDATGSFVDLLVTEMNDLNGIEGDEAWVAETRQRADKALATAEEKAASLRELVRERLRSGA